MIAGLQWIYDNKDLYNIKVVNISMNSAVPESYNASPLASLLNILPLYLLYNALRVPALLRQLQELKQVSAPVTANANGD